ILHGICHQLRRDRAELDRPVGQALSGLPDFRVLHFSRPNRPDDLRHHAGFKVVVQDMAARKTDAAGAGSRELWMRGLKTGHVTRRIGGPGLTADVLVESAVSVGYDIKTRNLLFAQIAG